MCKVKTNFGRARSSKTVKKDDPSASVWTDQILNMDLNTFMILNL